MVKCRLRPCSAPPRILPLLLFTTQYLFCCIQKHGRGKSFHTISHFYIDFHRFPPLWTCQSDLASSGFRPDYLASLKMGFFGRFYPENSGSFSKGRGKRRRRAEMRPFSKGPLAVRLQQNRYCVVRRHNKSHTFQLFSVSAPALNGVNAGRIDILMAQYIRQL